jgi:hypothetical protein
VTKVIVLARLKNIKNFIQDENFTTVNLPQGQLDETFSSV